MHVCVCVAAKHNNCQYAQVCYGLLPTQTWQVCHTFQDELIWVSFQHVIALADSVAELKDLSGSNWICTLEHAVPDAKLTLWGYIDSGK